MADLSADALVELFEVDGRLNEIGVRLEVVRRVLCEVKHLSPTSVGRRSHPQWPDVDLKEEIPQHLVIPRRSRKGLNEGRQLEYRLIDPHDVLQRSDALLEALRAVRRPYILDDLALIKVRTVGAGRASSSCRLAWQRAARIRRRNLRPGLVASLCLRSLHVYRKTEVTTH